LCDPNQAPPWPLASIPPRVGRWHPAGAWYHRGHNHETQHGELVLQGRLCARAEIGRWRGCGYLYRSRRGMDRAQARDPAAREFDDEMVAKPGRGRSGSPPVCMPGARLRRAARSLRGHHRRARCRVRALDPCRPRCAAGRVEFPPVGRSTNRSSNRSRRGNAAFRLAGACRR
jgi:hypothetical protein